MKVLNSIEKNWINFHIQNQALIACVIKENFWTHNPAVGAQTIERSLYTEM